MTAALDFQVETDVDDAGHFAVEDRMNHWLALMVVAMLDIGCGGSASSSVSTVPADAESCTVTDGMVDATWGSTALSLSATCSELTSKLDYIKGADVFQLCARDANDIVLVLSPSEPAPLADAQVYLATPTAIPWVANSFPGFAVHVTAKRPPGYYVEGTFDGLIAKDAPDGTPTEPPKRLSGSFKVCRGPDEPPPQ